MRFLASVARAAWWTAARARPPLPREAGLLTPHAHRARVSPLDLDANLHVNNASLLLMTELARWRMLAESGSLAEAWRRRWVFMVGGQAVRYRHEMTLGEPYAVHTELLARDAAWFWFRHRVVVPGEGPRAAAAAAGEGGGDKCAAQVLVRIIIKRGRDTVAPEDAMRAVGVDASRVPTPDQVPQIAAFLAWDAAVKREMG